MLFLSCLLKSTKNFITVGFCWVLFFLHFRKQGIGTEEEWKHVFQSWWWLGPLRSRWPSVYTGHRPFFLYGVFKQHCWLNSILLEEKPTLPMSTSPWTGAEDWAEMSDYLWPRSLSSLQSFYSQYKGEVEAFGFSSPCPLYYCRWAHSLKDVALSEDTDHKVHWLETNRSLSTPEGLVHLCPGLLC